MAEGRLRVSIAQMALLGLLEQTTTSPRASRFTVKGGVALELRLLQQGPSARATVDIDLVLHELEGDAGRAFENAATAGEYGGFRFRRKGDARRLDNGTVRLELAVTYRGGTWTSIRVDVGRAEPGQVDSEFIKAWSLEDLTGIRGPSRVACLPLRLHIAHKLHGMTLPSHDGRPNERVRDLADLLLLDTMTQNYDGVREACEQVFHSRGTHPWPPFLQPPLQWEEPFKRLARDWGLPASDLSEATERARDLVARILAHGPAVAGSRTAAQDRPPQA